MKSSTINYVVGIFLIMIVFIFFPDYPNSKKATIRRGIVKKIKEDSFDFQEDKDGFVTYSDKYLVEIKWKTLIIGIG